MVENAVVLFPTSQRKGMLGKIAAECSSRKKASTRAKVYRGGVTTGSFRASYRDLAYERKDKAIVDLSELLVRSDGGLTWGWGRDEMNPVARNVLYVDLPTVSQAPLRSSASRA